MVTDGREACDRPEMCPPERSPEDELRELGLPVVPQSERLAQVRETVRALRDLDGPTLHTPVVMAVRGPKAQALAAEVADTVTFVQLPGESRAEVARLARDFRAT